MVDFLKLLEEKRKLKVKTEMTDNTANILDMTLDDLADMPSIKLFPNGAHKGKFEFKLDLTKQSVQAGITYVEPVELADPTVTPPEAGDKNTVFLHLKKKDGTANEMGQGLLKEILKVLVEGGFKGTSIKETLEKGNGVEMVFVSKTRKGNEGYNDQLDVSNFVIA